METIVGTGAALAVLVASVAWLARAITRPTGWVTSESVSVVNGRGKEAERPRRLLTIGLPTPTTVFRALGTAAAVLFGADLAMQTIDDRYHPAFIGWPQTLRILDLEKEASLGTWFSVIGLVVCALLFGVIAYATREEDGPFQRHWWFLALVFLGFSLDEQAKFHDAGGGGGDAFRERLGLSGPLYFGWVVVALISVAGVAFAYRHFIVALPGRTRTLLIAAAGLYVGGEVGAEMVNAWLMDTRGKDLLYNTFTSLEEFLGLMGIVVTLSALLNHVRQHVGNLLVRASDDGSNGSRASSPLLNRVAQDQRMPSPSLTVREEVGPRRRRAAHPDRVPAVTPERIAGVRPNAHRRPHRRHAA